MMNIGSIGGGFLRLGKNSVYLIGRMCALIDAHSTALENLDTDDVDAKYASDGSWILPAGVGGVSDSGLDIAGTPGLFKVVSLVGWTLSSAGVWTQMTIGDMVAYPPTALWEGQAEAGNYLRPTWDYVRAYEET